MQNLKVSYARWYFSFNKTWYNIGNLVFYNPKTSTYGKTYANGTRKDIVVFNSSDTMYLGGHVGAWFTAELVADTSTFLFGIADQNQNSKYVYWRTEFYYQPGDINSKTLEKELNTKTRIPYLIISDLSNLKSKKKELEALIKIS